VRVGGHAGPTPAARSEAGHANYEAINQLDYELVRVRLPRTSLSE
jgi:hypothetical protein